MSESNLTVETPRTVAEPRLDTGKPATKPVWETPRLEDVSEQVMAQPYIRFT
jgi:hypothetical protein